MMDDFSDEQKLYLQGLVSGLQAVRGGPGLAAAPGAGAGEPLPAGPERVHFEAQQKFIAAGRKLTPEEIAKRRNPLDMWDELRAYAASGTFPKGTDILRTKFHGLFNVAPAQQSFMCRLRIPCGILSAHQLVAIADLAEHCAGGYAHVTTRANLQIREIPPARIIDVLNGLQKAGLTSRGSGADNIRNVTGNPTAGIDAQELYDVRPLCDEMHYYILNHREMYGLPRKFNIAFDGGGTISAVEDTNDIGFTAVRVGEGRSVTPGVYFRMALGGITGHRDFARDCGILLKPEDCVPAAAAVVRVFIDHGDRTDRAKARMKYVLDRLGLDQYLEAAQKVFGRPFVRLPLGECEPRKPVLRLAHVGFHRQRQPELHYVGVVLAVGKLTCDQLRGLARIAGQHGGTVRLTVWQNLLVSDIPEAAIDQVKSQLAALGLAWEASHVRAGLIACTGNRGCKFSASDTKTHAMAIADHLDGRVALDQPLNIHLTGCHHSCAQHYIGDIGLLAAKVDAGDAEVEGYHILVGGGHGETQKLARELYRGVRADQVPLLIERIVRGYLDHRAHADETFQAFTSRHEVEALRDLFAAAQPLAA